MKRARGNRRVALLGGRGDITGEGAGKEIRERGTRNSERRQGSETDLY